MTCKRWPEVNLHKATIVSENNNIAQNDQHNKMVISSIVDGGGIVNHNRKKSSLGMPSFNHNVRSIDRYTITYSSKKAYFARRRLDGISQR